MTAFIISCLQDFDFWFDGVVKNSSMISGSGRASIFFTVNSAVKVLVCAQVCVHVCVRVRASVFSWHDLELLKGLVSIGQIYVHTNVWANWGRGVYMPPEAFSQQHEYFKDRSSVTAIKELLIKSLVTDILKDLFAAVKAKPLHIARAFSHEL